MTATDRRSWLRIDAGLSRLLAEDLSPPSAHSRVPSGEALDLAPGDREEITATSIKPTDDTLEIRPADGVLTQGPPV
jgi:hypothetical protein